MPVDLRRRSLAGALGAAALMAPWPRARAQAFPSKPLRIVHGYDAGSNPDTVARVIGPSLTERLGQPIIVESRPGAGGRIATGYVATQAADGYTLMMLTAGDGVVAATDSRLSYDLRRDYAFISSVVQFPFMVLVSAESALKALPDMIEAARRNPGKLTFGTPGITTTQHLGGELIKSMAGIDLLHVPFKGNPFTDVIAGRLDMMIAAPSISTAQVKSGKLRAIAVTGARRLDTFPDVPTVGETLSGYEVSSWLGLAAPAKTSAAIVDRLSSEVRQVLALEAVKSRLLAVGSEPAASTPDEFRARVESDIRKWEKVAGKASLDR